jgi:hypothetical protein
MPINREELAKKAKSEYGKYVSSQPNKFLSLVEKIFLKTSLTRSFINGAITATVILYWILGSNPLPLIIWAIYNIILNIFALIYWRSEKKRLDKEIKKCEAELQGLGQEIAERKSYFDRLYKELSNNKN